MPDESTSDEDLTERAAAWGLTPEQFRLRREYRPAWICYAFAGVFLTLGQVCFYASAQLTSIVDVSMRQRGEYWACAIVAGLIFFVLSLAGLVHSIRLWLRRVPRGPMLTALGAAIFLGGTAALALWSILTQLP